MPARRGEFCGDFEDGNIVSARERERCESVTPPAGLGGRAGGCEAEITADVCTSWQRTQAFSIGDISLRHTRTNTQLVR